VLHTCNRTFLLDWKHFLLFHSFLCNYQHSKFMQNGNKGQLVNKQVEKGGKGFHQLL
jgi:hypothetical protein